MTKETTVENILTQIQTEYSKGINSDSSQLSYRYIYSKALGIRARLLSQKSKSKQVLTDNAYSVLPCIEIIQVEPTDCPFVPPIGCSVARSKEKLPKILTDYNSELIKRVGSISPVNGSYIEFTKTEKQKLKYQSGSKFAKIISKYYLHDGYLYLQGKNIPKIVEVVALCYDPFEVAKFNNTNCGINDCITPYDIDFQIDWDIVQPLILMTAEQILTLFGVLQRNDRNEDNVDENQQANEQIQT